MIGRLVKTRTVNPDFVRIDSPFEPMKEGQLLWYSGESHFFVKEMIPISVEHLGEEGWVAWLKKVRMNKMWVGNKVMDILDIRTFNLVLTAKGLRVIPNYCLYRKIEKQKQKRSKL